MPGQVALQDFLNLVSRVAVLEERSTSMEADIASVKVIVIEIRDWLVGAKGVWRVIIGAVTFLAALGGIAIAVVSLLPFLHKAP